jgi:hypothetical protein
MSDSSALPAHLAFEPVASTRRRHDGWTPERQRGFILALSKIGMVSAAAKTVGMSRKSAYALLARAGPESGFARAWIDAADLGRTTAWSSAVDKAINGVEVPYFYRGIQRGTRRVYNDGLLLTALRAMDHRRDSGGRNGRRPRASARRNFPWT